MTCRNTTGSPGTESASVPGNEAEADPGTCWPGAPGTEASSKGIADESSRNAGASTEQQWIPTHPDTSTVHGCDMTHPHTTPSIPGQEVLHARVSALASP